MNNKAVILYSNGLDSLLALNICLRLGLDMSALFIKTPFYQRNTQDINKNLDKLKVKLYTIEVYDEYFDIIKNPRYGFGRHLNPCLDCRIMMFAKAKELMNEIGASFIVSGEVLGERPFSQRNKTNLFLIENTLGLNGLILRPLSAKLLPPSIPEQKGIVDRNKLYAISGRSRKPQLALAKLFNISDFETPSGGCLLTEPHFANRLKNFLELNILEQYSIVSIGRHFKIDDNMLIVARSEVEYEAIASYKGTLDFFETKDGPGACAIFLKESTHSQKLLASKIVLRYSKKAKNVLCFSKGNCQLFENIKPIEEEKLVNLRVE